MSTVFKPTRTKVALAIFLLLLLAGAAALYTMRKADNKSTDTAQTTSTVESAQSDFMSDDTRKDGNSTSVKNDTSGGISDTNGSAASESNSGKLVSSNGEITVYGPQKNSLISNGSTVSGASRLQKVYYRIIDSEVGEISSGSLNVVNGKFSGTISFQTDAPSGQLDFFGTQSDGNEFGNITVPVRYK